MFMKIGSAKEIGGLTDFLVNNPSFRQFALKTHQNKKSIFGNIEAYLDKEILGKDYVKKEEPLHLNTKGRNYSNNNQNYDKKQ